VARGNVGSRVTQAGCAGVPELRSGSHGTEQRQWPAGEWTRRETRSGDSERLGVARRETRSGERLGLSRRARACMCQCVHACRWACIAGLQVVTELGAQSQCASSLCACVTVRASMCESMNRRERACARVSARRMIMLRHAALRITLPQAA
jgi:hypothetical protein